MPSLRQQSARHDRQERLAIQVDRAHGQPLVLGGVLALWGFLYAVAFTAGPILAHLNLPLVDLPNHIARLHIAGIRPENALSQYYNYKTGLVPNSAVDLIWLGLGMPGDLVRFSNLIMASYAANLIASVMVLGRVVQGRWSLWSASAGLLVFSAPFYWGFQNFVWSLPFVLYGIALWLALGRRAGRARYRFALFVPYAAVLYLMHFFAFGFLAAAILGREVQVAIQGDAPPGQRVLHVLVQMIPFAIPMVWLLVALGSNPPSPAGSNTEFGTLSARLQVLLSLAIAPNADDAPALNVLGYLGLSLIAFCGWHVFKRQGRRLVVAPEMKGILLALIVVSVLAPATLNGVAYVQIRAPILVCAVVIASTSWVGLTRQWVLLLVLAFGSLILARGVAFERFAAVYDADVKDMHAATRSLVAGDRVLPLRAEGRRYDRRLYHVQGLMVAERDVFVPTLFQGVHSITLKQAWASHAHPALAAPSVLDAFDPARISTAPVFVQDWTRKFTHILLLDDRHDGLPEDRNVDLVKQVGRFSLYLVAGR